MQTSLVLLVLGLAVCWNGKADIVCKKGKLAKKINVGEVDSYVFKTQAGRTYAPNTKCFATYKKKASCPEMRFSCSEFNINNKHTKCKGKDVMQIQTNGKKKFYCKKNGPDVTTTGKTLKVSFLSDKRKQSSGAICRIECVTPVETTIPPELPVEMTIPPEIPVEMSIPPEMPVDMTIPPDIPGRINCPADGIWMSGQPTEQRNASTWEICGNICFQNKSRCGTGWTWNIADGVCKLYNNTQKLIQIRDYNHKSGERSCPVDDCKFPGHFSNWWSVISACFKKRVLGEKINNPDLCEAKPNTAMMTKINEAVQQLETTVQNNTDLRNLSEGMFNNVPTDYLEYCPANFSSLIVYLNEVATITPPFTVTYYAGVPITIVLLCLLHTQDGRKFFANPKINSDIIKIVNTYGELLQSPDSLTVFNDRQYGWMSKCAKELLNMTQFEYKPHVENWGFKSFNDFFTRNITNITKTRPCDNGKYVLTSFGDVELYNNITDVKLNTTLYMKNETYSLSQIFNNDAQAKKFEGGAILQAFFSAHKYHQYHSVVDGTVNYTKKEEGIIYAIDKINAGVANNFTGGEYVNQTEKLTRWLNYGGDGVYNTQLYLAHVATRCIFVIDSPSLGQVGLVFIGMTEISSCTMVKNVGDQVKKGDKLGLFQFGGSTGLVALQKETVDNATAGQDIWSQNQDYKTWKMCERVVDLSPPDG